MTPQKVLETMWLIVAGAICISIIAGVTVVIIHFVVKFW
jgi:hypothetical protein